MDLFTQTQRFILALIGIAVAVAAVIAMAVTTSGNSTVDETIQRHLDMCDGIEDDALRIECYEGVPTRHELING